MVTNRLHNLQQEQERLSQALADDVRWQLLVESGRSNCTGVRLEDLHSDAVEDLAENELFSAYVTVTRAIEEMQASEAKTLLNEPTDGSADDAQPFRTRVNIKSKSTVSDRIDDLTAIRGITRKLAGALNELGVFSYQAIADWDRYEVRRVRDALELNKRIWRENWIEQAALLQMRQLSAETAADVAAEPDSIVADERQQEEPDKSPALEVEPTIVGELPIALPVTVSAVADEQPTETLEDIELSLASGLAKGDEHGSVLPEFLAAVGLTEPDAALTEQAPIVENRSSEFIKVGRRSRRLPAPAARRFAYLSGVSDEMAEALRSAGVKSIAEIASWTRADVKWFRAILGEEARISRDQWIEQATLLSKGFWTDYALRVVRGETRALVAKPDLLQVNEPTSRVDELLPLEGVAIVAEPDVSVSGPADREGALEAVPEIEQPQRDDDSVAPAAVLALTAKEPRKDGAETGATEDAKPNMEPVAAQAKLPPTARFDSMRGLTTAIALGKLRRPPPDLGANKPAFRHQIKLDVPLPPPETPEVPVVETVSNAPSSAADYLEPSANTTFDAIPPVRLEALPELVDYADAAVLSGAADWDDAEALVVTKKGSGSSVGLTAQPVEVETPPSEQMPVVELSEPAHVEAWNDTQIASGDDTAIELGDDAVWGDEADVVIVSKPRSLESSVVAEPPPRPESATERARKRLGIASRTDSDPPRGTAAIGGYDHEQQLGSRNDSAEEATVTIIRAEASEERASSIVPRDIANDVAALDQQAPKPRVRALGSRFLKALTGD
ncbi:MAG: putative flap endonuclease-1-like 5' DNA nuclease [Alphaproteobacteria bacterium]